ncbi:MAG: potassium channel protein [Bradyrhizobium sp.]|nr:potassium channel protein [Bradyrhizobium sp.]
MVKFLSSPLRNLAAGLLFMLVVSACATVAYMANGWDFGNALYMVVLTVYTVGYEEVRPIDTPELRAITIALIVTGCTGMIFLTGALVQLITASQLQQLFGYRRMQKDIDRLTDHVIICGYGRIGQMLARELQAGKCDFVIIERGDGRMSAARELGFLSVQGDATDEDVLRLAGVARARALATVLPDDAANVFITLSARSLNRELTIIARGEVASTEGKLIQAGADRVVLPTRIGAERMAEILLYQDIAKLLSGIKADDLDRLGRDLRRLGLEIEVVAAAAGSQSVGATIGELEALAAGAFLVVALDRQNGDVVLQPSADVAIHEGDGVAIVGRPGRARVVESVFTRSATG